MFKRLYSLSIVLVIATVMCLFTSNVNAQAAVRCGPQPGLSTCNPTPECEGIVRKAHSTGCKRKNGKPFNDGGCQCKGYCGYKCAAACQADPECRWNAGKKKCFNIATGQAGKPLQICAATNSPVVTVSPTNIPTSSPTPRPSKSPRAKPTKQPTTQGLCTHDANFPGREVDPYSTRTVAMSSSGDVVLFSHTTYVETVEKEYEYEWVPLVSVSTLYVTKRNANNGKWIPQEVGQYWNVSSIKEGAMSEDGANLVFFLETETQNPLSQDVERKAVFVKRQPNGKYKTVVKFSFDAQAYGIYPKFWMNAAGNAAVVSYIGLLSGAVDRFTKTKRYVRQKDTWKLDTTQDDVLLQDFSRDGKTAYSQYENRAQYKFKQIYALKNKKWVLINADLVGNGTPRATYQGTMYSGFSFNGKYFIMGSDVHEYFPGNDHNPDDSGAFVFVRTNGNYTQVGPKLGGGNRRDGAFTGISDDFQTILVSDGNISSSGNGFRIYKKNGDTWTEVGFTQVDAFGPRLNAKGNRVITLWPPTAWVC